MTENNGLQNEIKNVNLIADYAVALINNPELDYKDCLYLYAAIAHVFHKM